MTCASENINNNNNNNNRTIDMAQWHGLRSTKGLCSCCWPFKIRYNIMLTWYFQTISLWWTSARIVRLSHILEMEFNGSDWPGTQCEWEAALSLLFVLSIEICVEADISVYLNSLCCPFGADTKQSVLEERERMLLTTSYARPSGICFCHSFSVYIMSTCFTPHRKNRRGGLKVDILCMNLFAAVCRRRRTD